MRYKSGVLGTVVTSIVGPWSLSLDSLWLVVLSVCAFRHRDEAFHAFSIEIMIYATGLCIRLHAGAFTI